MKIQKAHVEEIVFHIPEGYDSIEKWLEKVGRTCYKSEDKITEESAPRFVRMLRDRGHHAMIEHAVASARIIGDRGLSHELVRHRIASFAQESTRYCNYTKGKFGGEISVIMQPDLNEEQYIEWEKAMLDAEKHYFRLVEIGVKPQIARSVLPIGLKVEIVITANLREWIWIFEMRCSEYAHPIIREVSLEMLNKFNERLPSIYEKQADKYIKKN
jgi:thymidylate synthase (FAD)